ncbi:MAG: peptide deformylase [Candidatus Nanopelagicales bacterium]
MTLRDIRLLGDPVLTVPASPVTTFDKELRTLVRDLGETMLDAPGAGLAAPQIGVSLRVFTFITEDMDEPGHLINPTLELSEEEQDGAEGCLSIPEVTFDCIRAMSAIARGFNEFGEPVEIHGTEYLARILQHETDHLDGIVFIDRMDAARRRDAMRAIRETEWFQAGMQVRVSPHAQNGVIR